METKIAVLYFGQLRIKNGFTCPLNAMKTQLGQQPFDVYIHCWFDPDQRTYRNNMKFHTLMVLSWPATGVLSPALNNTQIGAGVVGCTSKL